MNDTCPAEDVKEKMFNFMVENWDNDECFSLEEFGAMRADLQIPLPSSFQKIDKDGNGCLEVGEWTTFVRRMCSTCKEVSQDESDEEDSGETDVERCATCYGCRGC